MAVSGLSGSAVMPRPCTGCRLAAICCSSKLSTVGKADAMPATQPACTGPRHVKAKGPSQARDHAAHHLQEALAQRLALLLVGAVAGWQEGVVGGVPEGGVCRQAEEGHGDKDG